MRILIFGAAGKTGAELVRQALIRGDLDVTAFIHDHNGLEPASRLSIVRGDARNDEDVRAAVRGQDAVLSALGPHGTSDDGLLEAAMTAIVGAMRSEGVRRLVVLSAAEALDADAALAEQNVITKTVLRAVSTTALSSVMHDHARQDAVVEASGLDYTIVLPARLTDGEQTGHYRVDATALPPGATTLTRADAAEFMLRQLDDAKFVGKNVYVGV